jgi:tRNA threonylcarbamoyladenosine biosynthesis protein TsaB
LATLLGIETSTEACSVALYLDGIVHADHRRMPRQHNQRVLAMADALLGAAGLVPGALDAVAFGKGPGSFTGVRIAAGIAQGVALGRDLPVIPVSTLEVLAATALMHWPEAPGAVCALSSRAGESYVGIYAGPALQPRRMVPDAALGSNDLELPAIVTPAWVFCGDAIPVFGAALAAQLGTGLELRPELLPEAAALVRVAATRLAAGAWVDAAAAVPVYLQGELPWRKTGHAPEGR